MRLLFAAAEIFPFAKTGGLADVAHALPRALSRREEVTAVMPLYRFVDRLRYGIEPTGEALDLRVGERAVRVSLYRAEREGVPHLFLYEPTLCERNHPYGPPGGSYADNDLRFAIFGHALAALAEKLGVGLLHLNDWHTALAAPLLRDARSPVKTLFTIHNLAYQGIFPAASLARTGIDPRHFTMEDMEYYGRVNWMKGAIAHADAVTTVSPSYAREIQTPAFGCGLDGFLRRHADKLTGILNGIDTALYDPAADSALPAPFDRDDLSGKAQCKKAYLDEIDMCEYEHPLFIFIGRFVEQKGIDWIAEAADRIGSLPMTLAILGEGEKRFHDALAKAAKRHGNLHLRFGYDEALSHRMYGAADFLLMPSRFEPCGLNQMIAMRYGTVPVVHRVGGLKDTVHGCDEPLVCGAGIPFGASGSGALLSAVCDALALYADSRRLGRVRRFDMGCDFSVERCAEKYIDLYRSLV